MARTYQVTHRTDYRYEKDVTASYGQLHLLPRDLDRQQRRSATITLTPGPDVLSSRQDFFGNSVSYFEIREPHRQLTVTAESVVEVADSADEVSLLSGGIWEDVVAAVSGRLVARAPGGDPVRRSARRWRLPATAIAPTRWSHSRRAVRCWSASNRCARGSTPTSVTSRARPRSRRRWPRSSVAAAASARTSPTSGSRACGRSGFPRATSAATWRHCPLPVARS